VALLGLHMGLLEILHRLPEAPSGRPFRILTAPAFAPALTRFLARGRERDGKRILGIGGAATGLRQVAAAGGVLAFMADQVPGRPESSLRLWGRIEMPYPARLLAFLARRGFRILPVSTWQAGDGATAFRYHAPWPEDCDVEASLRAFLEGAIAEAPDQWNWSYGKLKVAAPA
jgi:lauroyl/myristoyl acyltransferase